MCNTELQKKRAVVAKKIVRQITYQRSIWYEIWRIDGARRKKVEIMPGRQTKMMSSLQTIKLRNKHQDKQTNKQAVKHTSVEEDKQNIS